MPPPVQGATVFEVDFLPIEKTGELGSKSGDAISVRFTEIETGEIRVVVIDGGYSYTGEALKEHIQRWYQVEHIDLMISTHADMDHINGLATVMEEMTVGELLLHIPHNHVGSATDFSNIEVVDALIGIAEEKGVVITEPFTGMTRFNGQIRILGPTKQYYTELVEEHLSEARSVTAAAKVVEFLKNSGIVKRAENLYEWAIEAIPFIETLGEDGETGPRNNSSVITLLQADDDRLLFTGDAGIPALSAGCDEYERLFGIFEDWPLDFFQAPHHGSRRNLSPSLLNRMFGEPGNNLFSPTCFISSAKNDLKHPSPKVTNALKRRQLNVYATEGISLLHMSNPFFSRGWGPAPQVPPLPEDE
jgi:beta-lactamase superfamily II metal-dependent hydrolase